MERESRRPETSGGASDEALMEAVRRGEEGAFDALFERYRSRLHAFLTRRCGDPTMAEDLFQETWLRAVRARDRYDSRRRFSTWIFQIANNLVRDRFRRSDVERRRRSGLREAEDTGVAPRGAGPASPELRLDVRRRLDALPDRLREVVVLRYYHGLPEREVAAIARVPAGTVKSRLHQAVRALRAADEESKR